MSNRPRGGDPEAEKHDEDAWRKIEPCLSELSIIGLITTALVIIAILREERPDLSLQRICDMLLLAMLKDDTHKQELEVLVGLIGKLPTRN
jgi:hypothetical protein